MHDERRGPQTPEAGRAALERAAAGGRRGLIREYIDFLRHHRLWYLVPIVLALIVLGGLVFLAGTSAAPFLYTLF